MKKIKNKKIMIYIVIILICITYMFAKYLHKPRVYINGEYLGINENKIYLDGAVKNSGTYVFYSTQTLGEIINSAGGLKDDADISSIDYNYCPKNGEKIIIKYIQRQEVDGENSDDKININEASKEQLMSLQGIGEKTAQNIIDYRSQNRFEEIEDILNVEGIGKSKFSNIKDKIIVE